MSTRAYGSSPSLSPRCSDTSYSPDSTDDGRSARNRAKIFPSLLAKSCSSVLEEFTTQNSSRFPLAKSSSNTAPDTPKIYGATQQSWEGGGKKRRREREGIYGRTKEEKLSVKENAATIHWAKVYRQQSDHKELSLLMIQRTAESY